jgi:uncharacterized membrane-anchored protein
MTTPRATDAAASPSGHAVRSTLAKVPEISIVFWGLKLLTTGMGEAISDALGERSVPLAALIGVCGITLALWLALREREYRAPHYWFAVMMVAVFGTMAADGIHDGAGIGYGITTPAFGVLSALVFWRWHRAEGTLDFHAITSRRRELYYWAAVLCTFALGTAAGDLTAYALGWGFWPSALLFAGVIAVPAIGWWRLGWNPIFSFWFAYVITRPLGASFADGLSKTGNGGLGLGDPLVAVCALTVFVLAVAWVTVKRIDVQPPHRLVAHVHHPDSHPDPRRRRADPVGRRGLGLDAD